MEAEFLRHGDRHLLFWRVGCGCLPVAVAAWRPGARLPSEQVAKSFGVSGMVQLAPWRRWRSCASCAGSATASHGLGDQPLTVMIPRLRALNAARLRPPHPAIAVRGWQ
jgi:hypothetical protein